jgi:inositol 2-dehydrogenase
MQELRFGVVGVGEMGRQHAENLRSHIPSARLNGIVDVDRARAQAIAAELQIDWWSDSTDELVARDDIDAVVISSPPKFHAAAIESAAAAGKHIFCEKPLALTLDDADAALEAVDRAGVILQIGHMRRYDPPYVEAKKRIDAGEIGDIVIFKSTGRDQETPPSAAAQIAFNGTLFHDSSSHDFDLARWLTGDEVTEVHAFTAAIAIPEMRRFGGFDSGVVNLQFARGAIGNVESFLDAQYGYDVRTEVVGTKGTIQVGALRKTPLVIMTRSGSTHDITTHWLSRFAEAYRLELMDFINTVRTGSAPRVSGYDGRQSLAIAVAAVESQRERRPVLVQMAKVVNA